MEEINKLFKEGGITTDGMQVDPVSGNEVPPGSLSEEVRDDVDAKLSTGEYVVPADVVRYFGVNFFEQLRDKAKKGLAEMDKDGRIGGEFVEEKPEEELAFAVGGQVADPKTDIDSFIRSAITIAQKNPEVLEKLKQRGISVTVNNAPSPNTQSAVPNPQQRKVMPKQNINPVQQQMQSAGFADGGVVGYSPAGYDPTTGGFAGSTPLGGSTMTVKNYINKAGNVLSVLFIGGKPASPIPDGYLEDTQENRDSFKREDAKVTDTNFTRPDNTSAEDNQDKDTGGVKAPKDPAEKYTARSYTDALEASKAAMDKSLGEKFGQLGAGLLGGMVAGPLGMQLGAGVVGGLNKVNSITDSLVNAQLAGAYATTPEEKAKAQAQIDSLKAAYDDLKIGTKAVSGVADWETLLEETSTIAKNIASGVTTSKPTTDISGKSPGEEGYLGGTVIDRTDSGVSVYSPGESTTRPQAKPTSISASSREDNSSHDFESSGVQGAKDYAEKTGSGYYGGGRARGGLISKPEKKPKKQIKLVSKK